MAAEPVFAPDADLRYAGEQASFARGERLTLSDDYRLCHLPLVAPAHPDVIIADEVRGYEMGRHAEVLSLVAPLDPEVVEASPEWRAMNRELADSPLADRIAWDIMPRRRARIHATLCSALDVEAAPAGWRGYLAALGPIRIRLGGVFAGSKNAGRLYLKLYPEVRDGRNLFDAAQGALGRHATRFYVAGVWNLTDHLDPTAAGALAAWAARWRDRTIAELTLDSFWLLASRDDLVLDAHVVERIDLASR